MFAPTRPLAAVSYSSVVRLGRAGVLLWVAACGGAVAAAEPAKGAAIYKTLCANCHGTQGQGSKEYDEPLIGDKSVEELARVIDKTMPEGAPQKCVGPDARAVAAYIHDAFYSPVAQARLKPARIEAARLTVTQFRNALTDLIGSFRGPPVFDARQGLKVEFFRSRRFQKNDRKFERIDPQVDYDFGTKSPLAKELDDHEFSIRWEGTILAPDSGDYEFVVRTDQAVRLWVNSLRTPLIDGTVKSGNDLERRASLLLLGGRAYAIRLEFSKSIQGVNDEKNRKKERAASVRLSWKAPGRAEEIIPARVLSPGRSSEIYVPTTPFPPDDRSLGYERGTSISSEWYDAVTEASFETAGYVAERLPELAGTKEGDGDREAKAREFCRKFVERAFRRPLTPEEKITFVDRPFGLAKPGDEPVVDAVKRVVLLCLQSPRFLYREVGGKATDPNFAAARLAWVLWDAPPDRLLLDAAAQGKLATEQQLTAQAERMLADPRAKAKVRDFFTQWLQLARITDLAKDPHRFPEFTPAIEADLRASLEVFVESVVWSPKSDFRELLLADKPYMNGRLAKFYGADLPAVAAEPAKAEVKKPDDKKPQDKKEEKKADDLPPAEPTGAIASDPLRPATPKKGEQAGVLTHPYLLAGFAYAEESSPIHRGVFISRSVLGRSLRPPPEAFSPLAPDLHPSLTNRQRVALQTEAESCRVCHAMINPLGFTLENFDAVGRFRAVENGKPVDAGGQYLTRTGKTVAFRGPRELAKFLAGSEETHTAFVEQMFHTLVKQPVRAYGNDSIDRLRKSFVTDEFHMRKLMVKIAVMAAIPPAVPKTAAAPGQTVR